MRERVPRCRGASTGPGIVVGHSQTGEMDKIDGPYYFFKVIQRLRNAVPQWMPVVGLEGGEINIVPVDFVATAMDHIAHQRRASTARRSTSPIPSPQSRRPGDQHLRARRPRARVVACGSTAETIERRCR